MKEEVTEYKTVEETYERTICDHCGKALERDEEAFTVALNPMVEDVTASLIELFETPEEAKRVLQEFQGWHQTDFRWDVAEYYGGAKLEEEYQRPAGATATFDWCHSCAADEVDVELPEGTELSEFTFDEQTPEVTVVERSYVRMTGLECGLLGIGLTAMTLLMLFRPLPPTQFGIAYIAAAAVAAVGILLSWRRA